MIELAPDLWLSRDDPGSDGRDRATRRLLADILGCDAEDVRTEPDRMGKPGLVHPPCDITFNRAGSLGWWVLGIARGRAVGVDLEPTPFDPDWPLVSKHLFSPSESQWLDRIAPDARDQAFGLLWTGKEAILKAEGMGIGDGVAAPDFDGSLGNGPWPDRFRHQIDTNSKHYAIEWIAYRPADGPPLLISRALPG